MGPNQQRDKYLPQFYEMEVSKLKTQLKNKKISITVDETTDSAGRAAINVLFSFGNMTKLVTTNHLQAVNNITISQLVLNTIYSFNIDINNIIFFISDNASYMIKAYQNLATLMPNLKHNTCIAHILNLVGETWQDFTYFQIVNDVTKLTKKTFTNNPGRKRRFIDFLKSNGVKNPTLPPLPVKTRWNTWFSFVFWLGPHLDYVKNFYIAEADKHGGAESVKKLINIFNNCAYYYPLNIYVNFIIENANR